MKFILIQILIFSSQYLFAQRAIDLFKMELPYNVLNSKVDYSREADEYDYYSNLDPSLIGYYLKYLDKKFIKSITNPDSNYYNLLRSETIQALNRRNDWLKRETDEAWETVPSTILPNKISALLNDSRYEVKYDSTIISRLNNDIDLNFIRYCAVKYINEDSSLSYQKEFDYKTLLEDMITPIYARLSEDVQNYTLFDNATRQRKIEKALRNLSVFKNSYGKEITKQADINAYEYLKLMLIDEYCESSNIGVNIGVSSAVYRNKYHFMFDEKLSSVVNIKFNSEIINDFGYPFHAGITYKQQLKKLKSPFSYIGLGINIVLLSGKAELTSDMPDTINTMYVIRVDSGIIGYRIDTQYKFKSVDNFKNTTISAQIFTPVFYAYRKLYIDAGLDITYSKTTFSYYVERNDQYYVPGILNPSYLGSYKKEYDFGTERILMKPVISVLYDFTDFLTFRSRYLLFTDHLNLEMYIHI